MAPRTVIEVPQWRASGSRTAQRLERGARLMSGMVPEADHVVVEVSDSAAPAALALNADLVRRAVPSTGFGITIGGDCGVELSPVAAARRRFGDDLVVVWFDAHGDLNTPESSMSGAFHGMVLRALVGEGFPELLPSVPLDPGRVVLAGARDLDPAEFVFIASSGLRHLAVADLTDPAVLLGVVEELGRVVYIHIDLDVLDPGVFTSVGSPAPAGLHPDQLLTLVKALAGRFEIVGLGITEFEPDNPPNQQDLDVLAPLVSGVVEACTP